MFHLHLTAGSYGTAAKQLRYRGEAAGQVVLAGGRCGDAEDRVQAPAVTFEPLDNVNEAGVVFVPLGQAAGAGFLPLLLESDPLFSVPEQDQEFEEFVSPVRRRPRRWPCVHASLTRAVTANEPRGCTTASCACTLGVSGNDAPSVCLPSELESDCTGCTASPISRHRVHGSASVGCMEAGTTTVGPGPGDVRRQRCRQAQTRLDPVARAGLATRRRRVCRDSSQRCQPASPRQVVCMRVLQALPVLTCRCCRATRWT